ncbi:hypothetical protein ABH931_007056 [Streptacidiphilus sp. MAP12-33]
MDPTGTSAALAPQPVPAPSSVETRGWDVPARQPLVVVAWCDRHFAAMLSVLVMMTDQPRSWGEALAEALTAPRSAAPDDAAPGRCPSHNLFGHRCPDGTSATDRVELTLLLMDGHSPAEGARILRLPELSVSAELQRALRVLRDPCEGTERGQEDGRGPSVSVPSTKARASSDSGRLCARA